MIAILSLLAAVQQAALPPEAAQFDFWVGDWTCEGPLYGPQGETPTQGKNHIRKILGGRVVQEQFEGGKTHGMSVSSYVQGHGWRQTWVDDQGGYIPLAGSFADGKMTLQTLALPEAKAYNRMVYENITKDAFDWRWESTADAGKTWKLQWLLHYKRAKR